MCKDYKISNKNMKLSSPLVSVFMTTYYHEKYISQALDSIFNQVLDFPIQVVISDDASGDHTVEIIKRYMDEHDNIKLNVNPQNIGLTANMFLARSLCDGKYIVDLSGDDYWIDNCKIAKQVAFLQKNPQYYAVCCRSEIREDFSEQAVMVVPEKRICGHFDLNMFLRGENVPFNGIMMKNPFLIGDGDYFSIMPKVSKYIDDLTDNLLLLMKSPVYILEDVMVAYRVRKQIKADHNFGTINKGISSFKKHIMLLNRLHTLFGKKVDLFNRYKMVVSGGVKLTIESGNIKALKKIYMSIPLDIRKRKLLSRSLLLGIQKVSFRVINKIKKLR